MINIYLILILIFAPIARGAVRIWAFGPVQMLAFLAFTVYLLRSKEIRFKRTAVDLPLLLFFSLSIASIINSRYIYASIMEIVRLAGLGVIFYMAVNFVAGEKDIRRLLNTVLIVSTSIALFGIFQYLGVIQRAWWESAGFLSATYVNHNHFAGYMELAIPLSIGMMLTEKDNGKRSMYIYAFLILSIAFLLSMSRGGWLSLSISMAFMAFLIFRKGKTRFMLLIALLFFATLGIFIFTAADMGVLFKRISSYGELDFAGRLDIWKGTLGIIKDNWLFGTGTGSFIYNFPKYRPAGLNAFVNYAHSDYLQVFSEIGIFGLFLMLLIIFKIIKKGLMTHAIAGSGFKRWIPLSLTAGVLSLAIHGMGDFNFYIPANAVLFTVFAGLIFNITSRRERGRPTVILKPGSLSNRLSKAFTLAAAALLIIFMGVSLAASVSSPLFAVRINPFDHSYHYRLAGIYKEEGENEKSIESYKESLRLNPLDSRSWLGLADVYYAKGLKGPARASYEKALALDPMNSYYLKKFAKFLLNTGDPALSSRLYKKASYAMSKSRTLSKMPVRFTDAKGYEETAGLAFSGQDINKALTFYKMAEGFDKDAMGPKLGLIRCYAGMSLIKEAIAEYRSITDPKRSGSTLFASLGDYCLRKGYYKTAERFSGRAIAADPGNPEGYQLRHKISKRLNGGGYISDEVSVILDFNQLRPTRDFGADYFKLGFDIGRKLHNEEGATLDTVLPAGIYEFSVRAKGEKAAGIWPHMKIRFNDNDKMDAYVNTETLRDYSGIVVVDYHANRFEIVYDNDYYDPEKNEDRNLYIEGITLKSLY